MPDPTLIVALKKKRLDRYGGHDDSDGNDDHFDLRAKVESLEARVSAIEEKYGMYKHEDGKEEESEDKGKEY